MIIWKRKKALLFVYLVLAAAALLIGLSVLGRAITTDGRSFQQDCYLLFIGSILMAIDVILLIKCRFSQHIGTA